MSKKQTNEGLFGAAKNFSDSFFDGLKSKTINRALKKAESNKQMPPKIIQKMKAIDKLSKELQDDLKYYTE
jgi:hypothetical protein